MKILHILTGEPEPFAEKVISEHRKRFEVTVIDLREHEDYGNVIGSIFAADKVISW